jgi:hypothetical protein
MAKSSLEKIHILNSQFMSSFSPPLSYSSPTVDSLLATYKHRATNLRGRKFEFLRQQTSSSFCFNKCDSETISKMWAIAFIVAAIFFGIGMFGGLAIII